MSEEPYLKGPDKPLIKAYHNRDFINSPHARPIRLLAEYLEPVQRLEENKVDGAIVFFGSARTLPTDALEAEIDRLRGRSEDVTEEEKERIIADLHRLENQRTLSRYYADAAELARRLTLWAEAVRPPDGVRRFIICSGGGPGIMEAANLGAHLAGGESIGLNISLPFEQEPNSYISASLNFEFHYFFMRKLFFMSLANAVIIFPGGFGTLDEFMEVLTLVQTGKVTKHLPIVLYGTSFWESVISFDALERTGMISPEDLSLFYRTDDVDDAYHYLTKKLAEFHDLDPTSMSHMERDPGHIPTDLEDR